MHLFEMDKSAVLLEVPCIPEGVVSNAKPMYTETIGHS